MKNTRHLPLPIAGVLAVSLLTACGNDSNGLIAPPDDNTPDTPDTPADDNSAAFGTVDERTFTARVEQSQLAVRLPVTFTGQARPVMGRLEVRDLSGVIGTFEGTLTPDADGVLSARFSITTEFALPTGTASAGPTGGLVMVYDLSVGNDRITGSRSLWHMWEKVDLTLLSAESLNIDGQTTARVLATNPSTGQPFANAPVTLRLIQGETTTDLFSGSTDEFGVLEAPLDVDAEQLGSGSLTAAITIPGAVEPEEVETTVRVVREQRVMVTTDKPMYQPGQTVHIRTLTLNRPSLTPAAERPVIIEMADAAGNMVYRHTGQTDAYGVAHIDVPLGQRLNQGNWTISATVEGVTSERTVLVDRYQLPDFGMTITPDRGYYRPGDSAVIDLDAQYFFGRPVAGGTVTVEAYSFDVGFNLVSSQEVTLSASGMGRVTVAIPSFLVGQELNGGNAFLRLDFIVTDAAGQTEELTRNLVVSSQDLLVSAIPSGAAVAGADLPVYVLTRTPDGRPTPAEGTLTADGEAIEFTTDAAGFAEVLVPVGNEGLFGLSVSATTEDGATGSSDNTVEFAGEASVAVFSDQAVYQAGDTAEFDFYASSATSRLFVDVIRDGQTLLTDAIDAEDGRAQFSLDLTPELSGALVVQAWFVTTDGRIVRGGRTLYVDSPGDLRVSYTTDREEYRPGDTATVGIQVSDVDGEGVQAAVGLTIVDEAVFALQDNQPGFERVYFQLEEELLSPAYNLYGFSIRDVVAGGEMTEVERERAAAIVLSQVDSISGGVTVNSLASARPVALSSSQSLGLAVLGQLEPTLRARLERAASDWDQWNELISDLEAFEDALGSPVVIDPWGRRSVLEVTGNSGWVSDVRLTSSGADEIGGTEDDVVRVWYPWDLTPEGVRNSEPDFAGGADWDNAADAGAWPEEPSPDDGGEGGEGGGSGPRVRQYFPETLWVQPDIITNPDGAFSMEIPLADSITTWRMTSIASSSTGELGSATGGIRVFQPFFVDIDVPLALTQGDTIEMPIAVFNYLETEQTVEIELDIEASGDWFEPLGDTTRTLTLSPGEITSTSFTIRALEVGNQPLQVVAIGTEESDAVRRLVRVEPDGQAQPISISGRLAGTTEHTITIPTNAIANANSLVVKIFPGLFGQVVEGLDSLFQMPSGCFEQTSSTTYPNILALQYLRDSEQVSPEIELKATQYIAQGYQALVSYEVPGGGFEWFGNDPAHRILTAYGLLEFNDMAEVFDIDDAIIPRTQAWLLAQQESDGRFRAAPEGIHEGATNSFQDSDLRATAYLTYALAESGMTGNEMDRAFAWLDSNRNTATDAYTRALIANAYLAADRSSSTARDVLQDLLDEVESEEVDGTTFYYWGSESQSLYYGEGDAMNMEVTALALQAFIRARFSPETVTGGIAWLVSRKDSFGTWSSTQATILSLRAFIELLENSTPEVVATVEVFVDEVLVGTVEVDETNADIFHQIDVSHLVDAGDTNVTLVLDGDDGLYYQLAGEYYLPWEDATTSSDGSPLAIEVSYDRTNLQVDEQVTVSATITNLTASRQDMVMLELGVPPGFDVVMGDFDAALADETSGVARVERIGRRVVLYLYGLEPDESVTVTYRLQATMVVEAQTPSTVAYLYYDSSQRTEAEPQGLVVTP